MDPRQITCAKCSKPVDKTEWWDERGTDERVFRVYCHGETDEMRLNVRKLSMMGLEQLREARGVAFLPRIGPAAPAAISQGGE